MASPHPLATVKFFEVPAPPVMVEPDEFEFLSEAHLYHVPAIGEHVILGDPARVYRVLAVVWQDGMAWLYARKVELVIL